MHAPVHHVDRQLEAEHQLERAQLRDELLAAESLQRAALLTSTEGDWAGYLQRYAVAARCYAADDEAPGALPRAGTFVGA